MIRGSIWNINLDPTVGAEIKKTRSCLILNSDKIGKPPLKIIALLTDLKEHYRNVPWMVTIEPTKENGLNKILQSTFLKYVQYLKKGLQREWGKWIVAS